MEEKTVFLIDVFSWSQVRKLSVDNVGLSFNGLTGPAHPTVTSLSAVWSDRLHAKARLGKKSMISSMKL
jgi:hypothetical protein